MRLIMTDYRSSLLAALFLLPVLSTTFAQDQSEGVLEDVQQEIPIEYTSPIEVFGNIGLVSDYVFRGITMSDGGPVLQGGLDIGLPGGFYLGSWLSGVDRPWGGVYNRVEGDEDFEYDTYLGWQWFSSEGKFALDTGVIRYGFSGDEDELTWSEFYISSTFYRKLRLKYSTDIQGIPFGTYYEGSFRQPLGENVDVTFHAGLFDLEERTVREIQQYVDFSVGLGVNYRGFRFDATYHVTDDDAKARYLSAGDDRFMLSVKRNFELYPNFRMFNFR